MSDAPDTATDTAGSAITPLYNTADVEALFTRLKKRGDAVVQKYRTIAKVNEAFYGGDQWQVVEAANGKVTTNKSAWFDKENVPRIAVNLYTGLLMTWSSLITANRPTAKAVPASEEPIDTYRAAISQKLIEFLEEEVDSANKVHTTVQFGGLGGTAGLKIVVVGKARSIAWEPVTVHDFLIDPSCGEDWRNAGWVIFEDHISAEDAEAELEAAKIDTKQVTEEPYKNAANEELHGVPRAELWMRPTRKYPRGLYACFVAGQCVDARDYPIVTVDDSGEEQYLLPLVLMSVRRQRGSVYGNTNFTDAVPLQRAFNESVSRVQKIIRTTSNVHLKIPQSMAGFDPSRISTITFPDAKVNVAKAIEFTTPPDIPQSLFAQRDFFAQAMEKVVGINSTTAGTKSSSLSGRAIENIVELDQDRNADCTRSVETMLREAYRLSLTLIRLFYDEPRLIKITNGDHVDVLAFQGADIEGVDVRLEPASEIDDLSTVKEKIAAERTQEGLAGPLDLQRAGNSPALGSSQAAAEQLVQGWLKGQALTELPGDLNFDVLYDVISKYKARALSTQDMGLWIAMDRLIKQIQQLEGRAQNLAPAQQPAANDNADTVPQGAA